MPEVAWCCAFLALGFALLDAALTPKNVRPGAHGRGSHEPWGGEQAVDRD